MKSSKDFIFINTFKDFNFDLWPFKNPLRQKIKLHMPLLKVFLGRYLGVILTKLCHGYCLFVYDVQGKLELKLKKLTNLAKLPWRQKASSLKEVFLIVKLFPCAGAEQGFIFEGAKYLLLIWQEEKLASTGSSIYIHPLCKLLKF